MQNFNFKLEPGKNLDNYYKYEKHEPVISIVICIYNGGEYLLQTVNSVLNQTYPYYELIIIDDGSTDKETLKIIDQVVKMDDRFSVYHKSNEGLSASKKYGLSKCSKTSKYIVYLDSDDLISNTYLETLYFSLETNNDYAFAYTDVVGFQAFEYLWQRYFNFDIEKQENLFVSTAMIRIKDLLEVKDAFICEKAVFEDWVLWLKLLGAGKKPLHVNYFGFWYRRSATGELSKAKKQNKKRAEKLIKEIASKMNNYVEAKQYPILNYDWNGIYELPNSIVVPEVKNKNKIKILFMIPWMVMGGADKFNLDVLKLIDKEKYEITIISTIPTTYQWRSLFEEFAYEVFDLSTFLDQKYWNAFVNYIIESRKIDVLLVSNSTFGYASIPYIKTCYPNLPIVDYIHMEEWYNRSGGYSRDSSSVNEFIDKTFFCNKKSEVIMNNFFEVPKFKTDTLYIGVDTEKFKPKKYDKNKLLRKYNIPDKKIIIGFICRIDYQKRPLLFCHIMKSLVKQNPDLYFVVAGDGPLLKDMKKLTRKFDIYKNVKFLGKVQSPEEIYGICDITVNCSLKEGIALTSYESLASGVPVVSSDVGGQSELINNSVGAVVPLMQDERDIYNINYLEEEINLYVSSINKVINNLNNYKKNTRKRIINGFTINNMIEKFEEEISNVIENPNKDIVKYAKNIKNGKFIKDYINMYFMADKDEYLWATKEYINSCYGNISDSFKKNHRKIYMFKYKTDRLFCKLRISNEASRLEKSIIQFFKHFIQTIKNLFGIIKNFLICFLCMIKRIMR